ncbi:S9 family peptidase [Candidatus Sumerlaeota bacterium]|nr:S9 family peptidase [Candidatus Sumerlaeota bacterium]
MSRLSNARKLRAIAAFLLAFTTWIVAGCSHSKSPGKGLTPLAEVPLIPRKVFFDNPDRASVQISPDGRRVSYLSPVDGVLNIWVSDLDNLGAAAPITADKGRGIRAYFWAFNNKQIIYLQDKEGDENWRVYAVDVASHVARDLTPMQGIRAEIEGVSEKFPNEVLIGLNDRNAQYHDLYRFNIETGEKTLVLQNDQFAGLVTDDDFQVRFGSKFNPDGSISYMQPNADGTWKEFMNIPEADTMNTSIAGFQKDGQTAYLIDSRGGNTSRLTTLDLKTGKQLLLAESKRCDVGGIITHPTQKNVQAVSFNYERVQWVILDASIEKDFDYLKSVNDGEMRINDRSLDDLHWIVVYLRDDGPVQYYHYDRKQMKATYLFSNRKSLEGLPLARMTSHVIQSRDGLNLVSYLTLPVDAKVNKKGFPVKPLPLVLNVHGGPWVRDGWGYNAEHQLLANRGYAVLSVNYRGSTGFGKDFVNAGNREWAAKMHDDLLDAVNWAVKNGIADRDRVAITGGSYGGYATLVGMTQSPDVFACGVDVVGPSNLVTLLNSIPPYWAPALQMFKTRVGDHTTDEGRAFLESRSPLNKARNIRKPLLIAQGANDPRVKQAEADQIVKAMKDNGIPVTYVLYPDEGHGFARPENNISFMAVEEAFLAQHLGGRFEPVGDAFKGSSIKVVEGGDQIPSLAGVDPQVP